ncbi:MAG: type II secretion system F family protein [bacterium]
MANYQWRGKKQTGEYSKGEITAENYERAIEEIRKMNIYPISVKKKSEFFTLNIKGTKEISPNTKISDNNLIVFTRQFSSLIESGVPILQGLSIMIEQQKNKDLKGILTKIKEGIENGASLSDSLRKFPKVFNDLYVNLVESGEKGGVLDRVFKRLSIYFEKILKLKRKIKGAMIYPIVVLSVAIGVIIILMTFVIPVFANLFSSVGAKLPALTRDVIGFSNFMRAYILYIIIAAGILIFALRAYHASANGKRNIDRIMLKIPVIGILLKKVAIARFARTLSTMVESGVPILAGLAIVSKTSGNKVIEESLMQTKEDVSSGSPLSAALNKTKLFPPLVIQMVMVGEKTGNLDAMLAKVADYYDEEVDNAVNNLTQMLEPALIIFLGVVVGTLVVAMYLPIFNLGKAIKG